MNSKLMMHWNLFFYRDSGMEIILVTWVTLNFYFASLTISLSWAGKLWMERKKNFVHGGKKRKKEKNVSSSRMGLGILTHNVKFIFTPTQLFKDVWDDPVDRWKVSNFRSTGFFLYRRSPPITLLISELFKTVTTSSPTRTTTMKKSLSFLKQITSWDFRDYDIGPFVLPLKRCLRWKRDYLCHRPTQRLSKVPVSSA